MGWRMWPVDTVAPFLFLFLFFIFTTDHWTNGQQTNSDSDTLIVTAVCNRILNIFIFH